MTPKNKLVSPRVSVNNKTRSRRQRIVDQEHQESLSGENYNLQMKYGAVQEENTRLKDQLQSSERELQNTSGNMKDIASKYVITSKRNKKQVNTQSKINVDQNALLRQKNMVIDGLQKQIEGNPYLFLTHRV
jgi:predicted RNase H-like nuclease (RuvC/YqgF family)